MLDTWPLPSLLRKLWPRGLSCWPSLVYTVLAAKPNSSLGHTYYDQFPLVTTGGHSLFTGQQQQV